MEGFFSGLTNMLLLYLFDLMSLKEKMDNDKRTSQKIYVGVKNYFERQVGYPE